jgi:hypothetical protein
VTEALVYAVVAGLLLIGTRLIRQHRLRRQVVTYRLTFPRGVSSDQVLAVLRHLGGFADSPLRLLLGSPALCLEARAEHGMLHHLLYIPAAWDRGVTARLRAAIPGIGLEATEAPEPVAVGLELRTTSRAPLRTDTASELSTGILAALASATGSAVVQWTVTPVTARQPAELTAADRAKYVEPLFLASGRVGSTEPADLGRLAAALRAANRPEASLRQRPVPRAVVARHINHAAPPSFVGPSLVNAAELVGLLGVPLGSPVVDGLTLTGARLLPASPALPRRGRVLGDATGTDRPIAQDTESALRQTWISGPTGTGKSSLMVGMAVSDIRAGRGLVLLDPKGTDLADAVLARVPPERADDVVLLDPTDDAPAGLNVLAGGRHAPELVADRVTSMFRRLYRQSWGPRTQDVLYHSLVTLVRRPDATLAELPTLLTNPQYRAAALRGLDDPVALGPFWQQFESLSDAERAQWIGPTLNKVRSILGRPSIRAVVGQVDGLDLANVIRTRKILICRLPKGLLGDGTALVGSLVMTALWSAVQGRAALPESQRPVVCCYLDEWQDFLHVPISLPDMVSQARSWGLALCLANQAAAQLTGEALAAVRANARTKLAFQMAAEDARLFSREFHPHVEAADLQALPSFTAYLQTTVDNTVQPVASLTTRPAPTPTADAATLRAASRARYGRPRAEVEAAIRARIEEVAPPPRIGRGARP